MELDWIAETVAEEKFKDGSRYVPTGNIVSRQAVGICVVLVVTEYLDAPVIHVDGTAARVNGNNNHVIVCSNDAAMYFARKHKGHVGIQDTLSMHKGNLQKAKAG